MGRPNEGDMQDAASFRKYAAGQQVGSRQRTTASVAGVPQYAATSFAVSDILQGSFAVKNQADSLLVINKALTQDLTGLYQIGADKETSFSTVPSSNDAQIAQTGGDGSPGTINADISGGGILNETWVNSLPTTHPTTKAILWVKTGKGSREMHIPVAEDLATDVATHLQHPDMPPEWKHPWNMDRVGGPIGGGTKIYTDIADAQTILGEPGDASGHIAAFGYLTPQEEEYYMSMAWPYKGAVEAFITAGRQDISDIAAAHKSSDYKGKKILVFSHKTKRGCVCTPGDWGPNPYWSNGADARMASINGFYAGLSPDVHWVLGTDHGDEFSFGFMPDTTPLGIYTPTTGQGTVAPTTSSNSGGGGSGMVGSVSITNFVNKALSQQGKSYVFNTGSLSDPDPSSFDCSGLIYWCAMQLGYKTPPGTPSDWSYSGTIIDMMTNNNTLMSVDEGIATKGAILARMATASKTGHVAISLGTGKSMEASSPTNGVDVFNAKGRDWTHAGFLPGIEK
jgi:hypothetical protein